jgi:hypothetical protein
VRLEKRSSAPVLPLPELEVARTINWLQHLGRDRGADPNWADTMDSLREPRKRDETFWEWQKNALVRPVVFEDSGNIEPNQSLLLGTRRKNYILRN